MGVPDVSGEDLHLIAEWAWEVVQPAPTVHGVVMDKGPNMAAGMEEGLSKVRPDETAGTCDQNLFSCQFHSSTPFDFLSHPGVKMINLIDYKCMVTF
jgi:hypothetical protein